MFYTDTEYDKMRWPIHKCAGKLLSEFIELKRMFTADVLEKYELTDIDILIRYIVYVYHMKSPLALNEPDIKRRKLMALEILGFKDDLSEELQKLVTNTDAVANYAKIQFIKFENSLDWLELVQYQEAYYQIVSSLTDSDAGNKSAADLAKTKLAVVKEMKGIKSDIDTLSQKIFKGDTDLKNFVASYLEEEKMVPLCPEDHATIIRKARGEV